MPCSKTQEREIATEACASRFSWREKSAGEKAATRCSLLGKRNEVADSPALCIAKLVAE